MDIGRSFWTDFLDGFSVLYLHLFLFVFWRELEHSCAREIVIADQAVHQLLKGDLHGGGVGVMAGLRNKQCHFHNTNVHLKSPLPICSHNKCLPWAICRNVLDDFCCINFGGFCRGFSWRIFLGIFPTKMRRKYPARKSAKKSGAQK